MDILTEASGLLTVLGRIVHSPHSAGLLGSLLSLQWAGGGWKAKVFSLGCGIAAWLFVAPTLATWLGLRTDFGPHLISLLAGMFGGKAAIRAAEIFDVLPWDSILSKFGAPKK